MSLAQFSIKQKVLINLITIIAIILGIATTLEMRREAMPAIEIDYVTVHALYPGASPFEVEKLISIPMEDAIDDVEGIESIFSVSAESSSFLWLELEPDMSNRDRVISEIGREVDKVKLPEDTEDPLVEEFVLEEPLIEISFSGKDVPEEELRQHVENFEQILKNIKGIGTIDKLGWWDKEISIEIEPDNLDKYYLSLSQVIQSIQNQNLNLPGGKLTRGTKEVILRTVGELESAKEFEEIIIRTNSDGKHLRLGNVAKAYETFEEKEKIYRTNGNTSINLLPKKKKSGDTIRLVDRIRQEVKKQEKILPKNVSIALVNDMAFYVKRRLKVLNYNGMIGLVLLIFTLLLFLNLRIAIVTALGIPFAFLTALLFMSFFDVSLNLLTMFGLILVLGMIVDDAIVVSENVYRYMEEGLTPRDAVLKGAREVAAPVTATILTTTAAFFPLMYIEGIMGKFLKYFPMGVIFCLSASLFEALVILPSHLAEWVRPLKSKNELNNKTHIFSQDRKGSEAKWFQNLLAGYTKVLRFAVHNRYKMCLGALIVLIASVLFSVKIMPFKLFPDLIETFFVKIETPRGTSLEETSRVLSYVEEICMNLSKEELENVTSIAGYSGGGQRDINENFGSQYGQCVVYLTPEQDRERKADDIINQIRQEITDKNIQNLIDFSFDKMQHGPPVGAPIAVEVRGDDYSTIRKITGEIQGYLKAADGIEDVKDNYELDKEELQITIDKKEAARLGLNVRQIAHTIRFAFEGGTATTMRKGDEDIEVVVRLPKKYRNDINALKELTIPNNRDRLIHLNKVAKFTKSQGIKNIIHVDRKRTITTTASIDENKITSVQANKNIIEKFDDIPQRYPGYYFKSGGEWEDTTESVESLFKSFGIAFMLIYMILATQFRSFIQPLIIMASIPFGIIGVIMALFFHGQPISLMALFGIVGLTGVVVNDSLILVDFINKRRKSSGGDDVITAVVESGRTRLRPILLTSITTIVALVPLIYGIGGQEPFVEPAAIAMSYGLLAATFLTLVIVPCIYLISEDIKKLF